LTFVNISYRQAVPQRSVLNQTFIRRFSSPLTSATLCVKPRGQTTTRQIVNVDALTVESTGFTKMRHLAMRFRGLLHGGAAERLDL
jgi:hypothetical protein